MLIVKSPTRNDDVSCDLEDLATELGVEIQVLEERLEMASTVLLTCCSFNGTSCTVKGG
jgi:hypothetical protein